MLQCYDVIMKALVSKDDVLKAREALLSKGKSAGSRAIHGILGRGSLGTITKFLREIEADVPRPTNFTEIQDAFSKFWSMAVSAGQEQAETQIKELHEVELALIEENERLQAEQESLQTRVNESEKSQSVLTEQLRNALDEAVNVRASAESHATKFAESLERIEKLRADHAQEIKDLRNESDTALAKLQAAHAAEAAELRGKLEQAQSNAHALEVALARAEAKFEAIIHRENASK
jgi:DNA repair exonuclease SbcCD ATPase subunit